jgi:hypothetical protein
MSRAAALLALLVAGAVLIGCGKDDGPPPEPNAAKPPETPKVPKVDPNAAAAKAADAAAKEAQTALAEVLALIKDGKLEEAEAKLQILEATSATLPADMQAQIKAARTSLDAAKTAQAADAAKAAEAAALQDAQTSLQKVLSLIKEGKLDEADAELKALEAKSGSLPEAMQGQIQAARTSLDAARAAQQAAAANQEAESLLARILALIKDAKLEDAEKLLKTLEDKSGSLSPDMQAKIKAARTALTAKKAAGGGIKLPGLPG